jgi:hypothetical protein
MTRLLKPLLTVLVFTAIAIPASAQLRFRAVLTGDQEVPVPGVTTEAIGTVVATFDRGFTKVHVVLRVRNGVGVTRAHFHCNRPGANGPIAFGLFDPGPLLFNGETAEGDLTNENFNNVDCAPQVQRPVNNIAALAFAMRDGLIYANVHSSAFPSGEIRGQLLKADLPDTPLPDWAQGRGRGNGNNGNGNGNGNGNDEDEDDD